MANKHSKYTQYKVVWGADNNKNDVCLSDAQLKPFITFDELLLCLEEAFGDTSQSSTNIVASTQEIQDLFKK